MSVTILEALQNAEYNFNQNHGFGIAIAKEKLHNEIDLLEEGYCIYDKTENLLEKYGSIKDVPKKKQ